MNSNFIVFLILLILYYIGRIIFCVLNKHRVGRWIKGKPDLGPIDAQDIVFESLLWPVYLVEYIILSPYKLLVKITELLCGQKKQ